MKQIGFALLFLTVCGLQMLQAQVNKVTITGTVADCQAGGSPITLTANQTFTANPVYLWSNGATTQSIVAVPGTPSYNVTITGSGLTGTTGYQPWYNWTPLAIEVGRIDSCPGGFVLYYYPTSGTIDYNVPGVWDNGALTAFGYENPPLGYHNVVATDNYGCTAEASYFVEYGANECGQLNGKVWADLNSDCVGNAGETGLAYATITITNALGQQVYQIRSGIDGQWTSNLAVGTYTVKITPPSTVWQACQSTFTVNVTANGVTNQPFFLKPLVECPVLNVDLGTSFLRRCFKGYYYIEYANLGSTTATAAYIDVVLDPFLTFFSSDVPATDLGNNTYRFQLGDLPINASDRFVFAVDVSCDATLGQTHCTEVTIFPHDSCGGTYTGPSLELSANCNSDSLKFQITNTGLSDMTTPLEYVIIEDAVMFMKDAQGPALAASSSYQISVPSNGSTWRLEAKQVPGHPGFSMPSLAVEGCTTAPTFSLGFVNQYALDDDDIWKDKDCSQNVFSYDPNDKQGFPLGYGNQHRILPGTDIEYMVRFQNTGTDTAFIVVIRDTLDANLDPTSIVPGASSHPYRFNYYGNGAVKFTFDPIVLPDSAANQEASNGFVSFRIAQRPNVPLGTDIKNRAAIYFDYNEAVLTNTTVHRVDRDFVTVAAWAPSKKHIGLSVSPNPMAETATLSLVGLAENTDWTLEIVDAMGKLVHQQVVQGSSVQLQRNQLPAGMYAFRVYSAGSNTIGTGKLIFK